jgi:hypothetical protein
MFKKFCLLSCLMLLSFTHAWAQDKPELKPKPTPITKSEPAAESKSDSKSDTKADAPKAPPSGSRAMLARPPQSGKEPMMLLGAKNKPFTEPVYFTDKLKYYDCEGIVAPWFKELIVAEMNYFAELSEMPFIKGDACVVSIGTEKSLTPGRISIHLYTNGDRLSACIRNEKCPVFRSVNLIPKGEVLYRSYFLSDMSRKLIAQHCVTAKGKLHSDKTCYEVP